jgi:GxxExxY protein
MQYLHSDITGAILKGFYTICSSLSSGLELPIYKKAIRAELEYLKLKVEENKNFQIVYRNSIIGNICYDFLINDCVGLRITNTQTDITDKDVEYFRNYLKETSIEVALILNFGIEGHHKRIFLGNDCKKNKLNNN